MTIDKRKLIDTPVKLNGCPAKIFGFFNRFATIATLDPEGPRFDWSWTATNKIVNEFNGDFKSGLRKK